MMELMIDHENDYDNKEFEEINEEEQREDQFIYKNEENKIDEKNKEEYKKRKKEKFNFPFYSCIFVSIIYFFISLFSYSYLNIIHLFLSFYFIFSLLNVRSQKLFQFSKTIIEITFILQFCYILIKGILFILNKLSLKNLDLEKIYNIFNIKTNNLGFSLCEMGISLFEFLVLLIYYSINSFNKKAWLKVSEKSLEILKYFKGTESSLLSIGLYFICLGCIIKSSIIHAFLIITILIHFSSILFNLKLNHWLRKKIASTFKYLIPFYIIVNYIFNCPGLEIKLEKDSKNKKVKILTKIIIVLYTDNNESYFKNWNILNIIPFIFLYIGYCFLVLFTNLKNKRNYRENIQKSDLSSSLESMNESIDVAQGIIKFYTESKHLSFYNKIKLYCMKYCYTPEFFLHLCRIGIIIWINIYITYGNIFFIIWIFLSISMEKYMGVFLGITKFTIFPLLLLLFAFNYIINIFNDDGDGNQKDNNEWKLFGVDNYKGINFFYHKGIQITIITFFQIYIYIQTKYFAFYERHKIDIENKKKLREKELNNLIYSHFKGNYIIKGLEIIFKITSVINSILVSVFFYLSICQNINIFNEIILLFIFSLYLFSKSIDEHYFKILIILNIVFIFKYIVYFIYPIMEDDNSSNIYNLLSLVFFDNLKNIYYSWIAFYFLYIEYCNSTSIIFQKCKSKTFSIFQLIDQNQQLGKTMKFTLITICDFIFGVYIWLIIACFIACLQLSDNNILFLIQLFIIFIIYYKYIKIAGNKYQNNENIFTYVWILILSSLINFSVIYIFQFLNKRPLSFWNVLNTPETRKNLELFGLFLFDSNYTRNFLPYMIMFIISISLYSEIDRQISLNSKFSVNSNTKKSAQTFIDGSEDVHKTYLLNDENLKQYSTKIYYILYYILHYYWIIVFIVVALLSIYWMLSFSMFIEIFIFSFYIMKSFKKYYSNITENPNNENDSFLLYNSQQKKHFKTTHSLQEEYFNLVWIFNLIFISLSYSISIVFKFLENTKFQSTMIYIKAIIYFLGVYSTRMKEGKKMGYMTYSFGYFLIIGLFSARAYFVSKFEEIKVKIEDAEERKKKEPKRKRGGSFGTKSSLLSLINPQENEMPNLFNIETDSNQNPNETSLNDSSYYIVNYSDLTESNENEDLMNIDDYERDKMNESLINKVNNKYRHTFGSIKSKDDSSIKYVRNKMVSYSISFSKGLKAFIEVIVIALILFAATLKANIISFIFLFLVFWTYKINGLNTQIMFYIATLFLILFNLQYLVFISNLSYSTDPFFDYEAIKNIKIIFDKPWCETILGYSWGFFLSCGVSQYQIRTLWIDALILIILYFYLEFFSFSLYENYNENKRYNDLYTKYSKKFRAFLKNKYEAFAYNMKFSYGINLRFNVHIDKEEDNTILSIHEREKKIKGKQKTKKNKNVRKFKELRNLVFLFFHQFILLIMLIVSSTNKGLISLGYMVISIYYIYNIYHFLNGKKWGLKNGIRSFIKPYLFFDITIQFIFQIPLKFFSENAEIFEVFMNFLGYSKLINYKSNNNDYSPLISMLMKILCYFLVLLQEVIYSSYDFKKYILKYHYEYMNQSYIIGKLHSFLFNNHRIKLMNDRLHERKKIEETLESLQEMMENWNNKIPRKDSDPYYSNIKIKKRKNEVTIGKLIRKHWLVKTALRVHYGSRHVDLKRITNKKDIIKILQGADNTYSELDEVINKFEEENANKFNLNDINFNRRISVYKKDLKEKEEQINLLQIENDEKKKNELYNSTLLILDDKKEEEEKKLKEEEEEKKLKEEEEKKLKEEEIEIKKKLNKEIKDNNKDDSDIFFPSAEYYEKKHEIRSLFFKKYYSKGKIIIYLIKSLYKYLIENFEYVCYFFMVIDNFAYGSIVSMFLTFLVFVFGITQYPRPKKGFWKFCLTLICFVILTKFTLQLNFIEVILKLDEKTSDSFLINIKNFIEKLNDKDSYLSRLGIKRMKYKGDFSYFNYFIFDFFVLAVLLLNQFLLIKKGLWYEIETNYETIEEANKRIQKYLSKNEMTELRKIPKNLNYSQIQTLIGEEIKYENTFFKTIKAFIHDNFNYIRNEKPGKDFYTLYTIFQILIIIYIILFYTQMEQDKLISNNNTFEVKQFSRNMIIFLLIHLIQCVIDRYIYLKNSRKIKHIQYKIYSKQTGKDVTKELYGKEGYENYENSEKTIKKFKEYKLISYQNEGIQFSITYKFILQIFSVIFIHIFIFWYLPIYGSKNDYVKVFNFNFVNELLNNIFILIFYILYCFYFTFSGLQIKYGLAGMRKVSPLMSGSSMTFNIIYKSFKLLPFLFELKNFIDWSVTPTALEIWQWLKFEEINAMLFINKCFNKSYMGRRIGTKRTFCLKITMGWSIFVLILSFVFGPIVLFSTLNPSSINNSITGTYMKVQLYYNSSTQNGNLTLFESSNSQIKTFDKDLYDNYTQNSRNDTLSTYFSSYKNEQIQEITIFGYGDFNWDISPHLYDKMLTNINNEFTNFYLRLTYSFLKALGKSDESLYRYEECNLNKNVLKEFFNAQNNNSNNNSTHNIEIEKCIKKYIRIPSEDRPVELVDETQNIILSLVKENEKQYWKINSENSKDNIEGITITTFIDTFSPITFGYNVLTFYMAFIVVGGNYIRLFFLGSAERVIYTEMVLPNKLLNLCEGIRIARIKKDYLKEEQLYYLLIDLMRSPEIIKNITKSSLIFIQDSNIVQKADHKKQIEGSPILNDFNENNRKSFLKEEKNE